MVRGWGWGVQRNYILIGPSIRKKPHSLKNFEIHPLRCAILSVLLRAYIRPDQAHRLQGV